MRSDCKTGRWLVLPLTALLAAACDDGTGPDRLSSEEVSGRYDVCDLRFTPEGAQPAVDIRTAAFELSRPEQASLAVDVDPQTFELSYIPKGQFSDLELRGTYELGGQELSLRFGTPATGREALLLPERIPLVFEASPRRLSLESSARYDVPRASYARLAGIPEAGLAERIPGTLSARFGFPDCS